MKQSPPPNREKKQNVCKHCGTEYNFILPAGYCSGCVNYLRHIK